MSKRWWCFCSLIIFTLFMLYYMSVAMIDLFNGQISEWKERMYQSNTLEEFEYVHERWMSSGGDTKNVKTILYWNEMYPSRNRHFFFGIGDVFRGCPVPHCYATPDRGLFENLESYDAVLFYGIKMELNDLPLRRSNHQRYIYFSWESPASKPINDAPKDFVLTPNYYNWTMTYRLDSDVIHPYGRIRDIVTQELVSPPNNSYNAVNWRSFRDISYNASNKELQLISGKRRLAAWFVSHCKTHSKRETLVKGLNKYFDIDIYGDCGELQCDRENSEECYDLLERDYFFYFSFENTLCKDYVTEKAFLPMKKYVIPVVYGGTDYSEFLPPHSYINIMNFPSIYEIANFLLTLSKNQTEYASYFWWKKYYAIEDSRKLTLCDLCAKLHNESLPNKSLKNFQNYYIDNQCYLPDHLMWYQHQLNEK